MSVRSSSPDRWPGGDVRVGLGLQLGDLLVEAGAPIGEECLGLAHRRRRAGGPAPPSMSPFAWRICSDSVVAEASAAPAPSSSLWIRSVRAAIAFFPAGSPNLNSRKATTPNEIRP